MDFRNVKSVTIPPGEVKKILIGDLVIWSKKSANKYKILKNGEQVANVTMSQFVKAIQSGAAQEDWGIGAQIIIPYHDSWDDNDYELPFNFGTFTAYGEGKLGLQAHYALPTVYLTYGVASGYYYSEWADSYIKKWLNTSEPIDMNGIADNNYANKIGFLGCIPEDFVECMSTTLLFYYMTKVFLLSLENFCCSTATFRRGNETYGPYELGHSAWEYWVNKIGEPQTINTFNENHAIYEIDNHDNRTNTVIPDICREYSSGNYYGLYQLTNAGYFSINNTKYLTYKYLPACVIG